MQNVDDLEIKKFEALAARWWDPTSEFKPLHEINPLRMGLLTSITSLAGKRVLDIGCGGGILAEAMARQGAEVVASTWPKPRCLWHACISSRAN